MNVNLESIALMHDEDIQKEKFPKIHKELMKNISCNLHKYMDKIPIYFIKATISFSEYNSTNLEFPMTNSILDQIQLNFGHTLVLSDDVFRKEWANDFTYYLSLDKHTVYEIDATRVSDKKIK